MSVRSQALLGAMVASWVVALGTTPASGALQEWEVGGAQIQLSRVMMLAPLIARALSRKRGRVSTRPQCGRVALRYDNR